MSCRQGRDAVALVEKAADRRKEAATEEGRLRSFGLGELEFRFSSSVTSAVASPVVSEVRHG
jgi:hypothetical protein